MDDNTGLETSFAQLNRMSKLRCYECNELGHVRTACPKLKKISHFRNEEGDDSAHANTLDWVPFSCWSWTGHWMEGVCWKTWPFVWANVHLMWQMGLVSSLVSVGHQMVPVWSIWSIKSGVWSSLLLANCFSAMESSAGAVLCVLIQQKSGFVANGRQASVVWHKSFFVGRISQPLKRMHPDHFVSLHQIKVCLNQICIVTWCSAIANDSSRVSAIPFWFFLRAPCEEHGLKAAWDCVLLPQCNGTDPTLTMINGARIHVLFCSEDLILFLQHPKKVFLWHLLCQNLMHHHIPVFFQEISLWCMIDSMLCRTWRQWDWHSHQRVCWLGHLFVECVTNQQKQNHCIVCSAHRFFQNKLFLHCSFPSLSRSCWNLQRTKICWTHSNNSLFVHSFMSCWGPFEQEQHAMATEMSLLDWWWWLQLVKEK